MYVRITVFICNVHSTVTSGHKPCTTEAFYMYEHCFKKNCAWKANNEQVWLLMMHRLISYEKKKKTTTTNKIRT